MQVKLYLLIGFLFSTLGTVLKAQTNPAAQAIPYAQSFSAFTGSVTTYPAGFQGWTITGSLASTFPTAAPSADMALAAGTNATTTAGVYDMVGKMGLVNTASGVKAICLAINTTSATGISVSYTAATQYMLTAGRTDQIGLQYRVGTTGTFTNIPYSTYQNDITGATTSTGTTPTNPKTISVTLPVACEGQAVVQLRWVVKDSLGSGNRPTFSIDDVSISAACSTPVNVSSLTATPNSNQAVLSWTNGSCFDEIMVVATAAASVSSTPTGNGAAYTANAAFATTGTGAGLSSNEYAVYKSNGTSVTVTGLTNGTTYQFKVFTRKGSSWSSGVAISTVVNPSKYYWNGATISASPAAGGSGTWGTANAWRTPTNIGAQATYTSGFDAVFAGTAGNVSLEADYSSTLFDFQTTGYVLSTPNSTTRALSGPMNLPANGTLNISINPTNTTSNGGTLNLNGSVNGTGSASLNLIANAPLASTNRLNMATASTAINVPITISGTGAGLVDLVATGAGIQMSDVSNNTSATFGVGATSGFDMKVNGVISGSTAFQFSAGSSGGAGVITLLKQNTYTGATYFNAAQSGIMKLGITNALPTTTDVTMSVSASNGGVLDLNGFDQTIGSITSGVLGGTSSITNGGAGTATNTLTINGSLSPTNPFDLVIKDGATAKTALTRAGTGTTVLSGANTYMGSTTVTSGNLIINGTSVAASAATVNGGTMGGIGTFNGTVTLNASANLSPAGTNNGSSTGNFTTGAMTWNNNSKYTWEINNWSGVAGNASGWDKVTSTGAINILATASNPIVINIAGLTSGNVLGAVPNFSSGNDKTFVIASGTSIVGFAANLFSIQTANFTANNSLAGGTWSIQQTGNNLELKFTAALPTPSITVTNTMTSFNTFYGTASAVQNFTIGGVNLTNDILVTAPTGFEIAVGAGTFSNSATLTQAAGIVNSTLINIRLTGASQPTTITGNLVCSTLGAISQNISLTGEVLPHLVINEINYNPNDAIGYTDANYEFLEIYNSESFSVNLAGYTVFGVNHTFGSTIIPANGYVVIAANSASYAGSIQWPSGQTLNNAGEAIVIRTPLANTVDSVWYLPTSPWPTAANGGGPSLELNAPTFDNLLPANWHSNPCLDNGTPGAANSSVSTSLTLYSRASGVGNTDAIWSCSPTGTAKTAANLGGFSSTTNLVIQNGHSVDFTSSISLQNLTIDAGGTMRRNSSVAANMSYLSVYGNSIQNNGTIGLGSTFDALGFNIEGSAVLWSGTGVANIGRIRKSTSTNVSSSLTINQNVGIWFPGTSIYNNSTTGSTFNITLNAGKTLGFNNSADLAMDGISGVSTTELYGKIDVYGSITGLDTLYARSFNSAGTTGISIQNGGSMNVNVIVDSSGVAANDFNFSILSGGKLEINTKFLAQKGIFSIPTGAAVIFKSTAANQVAIIDNFSTGFTGSISGNITAQRYTPVTGENQHFISSPINNTPLTELGVALTGVNGLSVTPSVACSKDSLLTGSNYGNVFEFNESYVTQGDCFMKEWVVRSSGLMTNAKGYSVYLPGDTIFDISGVPNMSNSYTVTNLGNHNWTSLSAEGQTYSSGWHLVGNPFLSTINLDATFPGLQAQVQVWQTTGNYKGTYLPLLQGSNAVIAPFQGFMVCNPTPNTVANFTVNRSEQISNGSTSFYKTQANDNELSIIVKGNGFADVTKIFVNTNATNGFDNDYDADKFNSAKGQPTIYSVDKKRHYGINTLESIQQGDSVLIHFLPGNGGSFELNFEGFETLNGFVSAILEDRQMHTFTTITNQSVYSFIAAKTDNVNRFVVRFGRAINDIKSVENSNIQVLQLGKMLVINTSDLASNWDLKVTNLLGQEILQESFSNESNHQTDLANLQAGAYVVTVTNQAGIKFSKKILIP